MMLFNNIPYKRIRLTSKVNSTKRFSEEYKRMRLITRLYGIILIIQHQWSEHTILLSNQILHIELTIIIITISSFLF